MKKEKGPLLHVSSYWGRFFGQASPWYNRTGWLGVKHQLTYLLRTSSFAALNKINCFKQLRK